MEICRFVISPIRSNCYVLSESLDAGAQAVIVDPGDNNLADVFRYVEDHQFRVIANWNTHAHFDHVRGVDIVRERYGIPAYVHVDDAKIWEHMHLAVTQWVGETADALRPPDGFFAEGESLTLGDETFSVWHTPGHSPGGVCFVGQHMAITGDTLFRGTVGRTDLPESSPEAMETSLLRILVWPDALRIYPGHGDDTTMGEERQSNRYLRIAARHER